MLINKILNSFKGKLKADTNTIKAFVDYMCVAEEAVKFDQTPKINDYIEHLNKVLQDNKLSLNPNKSQVIIIDHSRNKRFSNIQI